MKILFVGCYRDGTSLGRLAQQVLLGLDSAGAEIAARPFCYKYTNMYPLEPRLLELEAKSYPQYDCVIQCVPSEMTEATKEYGIPTYALVPDTDRPDNKKHRSLADKVIYVSYRSQVCYSEDLAHTAPIPNQLAFLKDSFVFYTIGKLTKSENWENLIYNFQNTFGKKDNVELLFKTTGDPKEVNAFFDGISSRVNEKLKKRFKNVLSLKQPIVINEVMSESDLMGLHRVCDAFVENEDFSQHAYHAMTIRNKIVPTWALSDLGSYIGDNKTVIAPASDDKYLKFGKSLLLRITNE